MLCRRAGGQVSPIDVLPDDVLLAIFDFYLVRRKDGMDAWQSLVHVCRRWRCVVFGSPCRLNLRLVCSPEIPARGKGLGVWPVLPLVIKGIISSTSTDIVVVAPEHRDRVCRIDLRVNGRSQWDKVMAEMQVPFPALTDLRFHSWDATAIPDTFLGGSAPRLRSLEMDCIPFPVIPNLLLSATHLVRLDLNRIPPSGYIPPETMVNCLSVLTSLDTFSLRFLPTRSRPNRETRRPPPMIRSVLPCLTALRFKGTNEYLDDLVAPIVAPQLGYLSITFLNQGNFDTPHLVQFISRTPRLQEPNDAHVILGIAADVQLLWALDDQRVGISHENIGPRFQPSFIAQVCTVCLPPLHMVVNLRLEAPSELRHSKKLLNDVEDDQWLELLRPFTAVKNLYLLGDCQPGMASALQDLVGDRTTEVLPLLQNIFLERFEPSGRFRGGIGQFVAARQLSGHPIAVLPL